MANQRKRDRRIRAAERLERQLAENCKTPKRGGRPRTLTADDRARINGELRTLETSLYGRPVTGVPVVELAVR